MKFLIGRNLDGVGQVIEVDELFDDEARREAAYIWYVNNVDGKVVGEHAYRFVAPGGYKALSICEGDPCTSNRHTVLVEKL